MVELGLVLEYLFSARPKLPQNLLIAQKAEGRKDLWPVGERVTGFDFARQAASCRECADNGCPNRAA